MSHGEITDGYVDAPMPAFMTLSWGDLISVFIVMPAICEHGKR